MKWLKYCFLRNWIFSTKPNKCLVGNSCWRGGKTDSFVSILAWHIFSLKKRKYHLMKWNNMEEYVCNNYDMLNINVNSMQNNVSHTSHRFYHQTDLIVCFCQMFFQTNLANRWCRNNTHYTVVSIWESLQMRPIRSYKPFGA